MKKNVLVAQSGGPTSTINATLSGVIKAVMDSNELDTIYGARYGVQGVIADDLINISNCICDDCELEQLTCTPSSALGTCRMKLRSIDEDDHNYKKIYETFKKHDIQYFFYIGGNDSMDTVAKLSSYFKSINYPVTIIGIPKTIDNDLVETDHTPGFGSAAKYVATITQEILRDCAVYSQKAVTIVEIMGRDAGWLTAASMVGRLSDRPVPELIYLPEQSFDNERFIESIKEELAIKPNVVVAISEGIRYPDGSYVGARSDEVDQFGHTHLAGASNILRQLVRNEIGCKARSVELNILQRSAAHLTSRVDITESYHIGFDAVQMALKGQSACMAVFRRKDVDWYQVETDSVPVERVANQIKQVPQKFLTPNGVNDDLLRYIKPLTLGEVKTPYEGGFPKHFIFK